MRWTVTISSEDGGRWALAQPASYVHSATGTLAAPVPPQAKVQASEHAMQWDQLCGSCIVCAAAADLWQIYEPVRREKYGPGRWAPVL